MNKHRAIATHPLGDVELTRGDKLATQTMASPPLTFAYVTDDGRIATQELGRDVVINPVSMFPGVEVQKHVRTIDLTPTWSAVLPMLLAVLEDGSEAGRKMARAELARMAEAADAYNAIPKRLGA